MAAAAALTLGLTTAPASAQAPRLLAPPLAADGTLSFADLVERVSPAVVSILTEREMRPQQFPSQLEELYRFRFGDPSDPFGAPFGEQFDEGGRTLESQGSGFFVDAAGHIVTNNHVIEGASQIRVRLPSGDVIDAELVGADPLTDLAVLKVKPQKGQKFVQFAEDVNLRVGDWVVAVGNPFGLSGTVTSGIVSAIGGEGRSGQFLDFIQIDAPINRGNSGGPTFDLKGRVVGVNTAIYSTTGGSMGIGFAIPAKVAKDTIAELIKSGAVTRGWLGVSIQNVTTEIAAALGRKEARGALISEVMAETPAAKAGFVSGDVVLSLNGQPVADAVDLTRKVSALPPGQKANVAVLRDGAQKNLVVTLGQRSADDDRAPAQRQAPGEDSVASSLGLRITEITPVLRQQFRIPEDAVGVLVTGVRRDSPAQDAGLQQGVVILQVDGKPASSVAAFRRAVEEGRRAGKEAVLLRYQIGDARQFGALRLAD